MGGQYDIDLAQRRPLEIVLYLFRASITFLAIAIFFPVRGVYASNLEHILGSGPLVLPDHFRDKPLDQKNGRTFL